MKNLLGLKKRYVIAIDPSGSYKEGNGTTGFAVYDRETDKIISVAACSAHTFDCWQAYYQAVWKKAWWMAVDYTGNVTVVIEDYLLYASKANNQINSILETPRLIGYLLMKFYEHSVTTITQRAVDVKNRWTDEILEHDGYITRISDKKSYKHCHGMSPFAVLLSVDNGKEYYEQLMSHNLDAIRHAVHYGKFGKE